MHSEECRLQHYLLLKLQLVSRTVVFLGSQQRKGERRDLASSSSASALPRRRKSDRRWPKIISLIAFTSQPDRRPFVPYPIAAGHSCWSGHRFSLTPLFDILTFDYYLRSHAHTRLASPTPSTRNFASQPHLHGPCPAFRKRYGPATHSAACQARRTTSPALLCTAALPADQTLDQDRLCCIGGH